MRLSLSALSLMWVLVGPPALLAGEVFEDLGSALGGTNGLPALAGSGTLEGGTTMGLSLSGALESSPAFLIVGLSELNAPFLGGTFVPSPDVVLNLATNGSGSLNLEGSWPFGVPFGTAFTFQYWVADGLGPFGFSASNALRATTSALPVPGTFPDDWVNGSDCANEPDIQVHAYNENLYILRQSMCTNFEGPFMFLIFGGDRVMLLDTGAGGVPLADTVYGLIDQWEADHGRQVSLYVTHTHEHGDHTSADSQFQGQPDTVVINANQTSVQNNYGFSDWPHDQVELSLGGGRILDVVAIPGHSSASIAHYDRETGLLLTGDTLYPGFLFIFGAVAAGNWEVYKDSIQRLRDFMSDKPVTHVLGNHIEMTMTPGVAYPYGTNNQPLERDPQLGFEHIEELDDALDALGGTPADDIHDDFIITPFN